MQYNHALALPSFILSSIVALAVEVAANDQSMSMSIRFHKFADNEIALLLLSCALIVSFYICTYELIKRISAVTHLVVGYAKTSVVMVGSFIYYLSENPAADPLQFGSPLLGLIIAIVAIIIYTRINLIATSEEAERPQRLIHSIEMPPENERSVPERQRLVSEAAGA